MGVEPPRTLSKTSYQPTSNDGLEGTWWEYQEKLGSWYKARSFSISHWTGIVQTDSFFPVYKKRENRKRGSDELQKQTSPAKCWPWRRMFHPHAHAAKAGKISQSSHTAHLRMHRRRRRQQQAEHLWARGWAFSLTAGAWLSSSTCSMLKDFSLHIKYLEIFFPCLPFSTVSVR